MHTQGPSRLWSDSMHTHGHEGLWSGTIHTHMGLMVCGEVGWLVD